MVAREYLFAFSLDKCDVDAIPPKANNMYSLN